MVLLPELRYKIAAVSISPSCDSLSWRPVHTAVVLRRQPITALTAPGDPGADMADVERPGMAVSSSWNGVRSGHVAYDQAADVAR